MKKATKKKTAKKKATKRSRYVVRIPTTEQQRAEAKRLRDHLRDGYQARRRKLLEERGQVVISPRFSKEDLVVISHRLPGSEATPELLERWARMVIRCAIEEEKARQGK